MSSRMRNRAEERFNAILSGVLMLAIVIVANHLAAQRLRLRRDFSEDQLFAISPATKDILAGVDETIQVKAFFTGEIHDGELALAKARLEGILSEFEVLSGGRVRVDRVDPARSSQVLLEAQKHGVRPIHRESFQGITKVVEDVYLGLVVSYRSRQAALSVVLPHNVEVQLATVIYNLMRDRQTVVGWLGDDVGLTQDDPQAGFGTFEQARALLASQHELRVLDDPKLGEPIPDDVDVLLVVRPAELHPRAVFELDQYVQRGGRLVVLVDTVRVNWVTWEAQQAETGLERLMRVWGVPVTEQHVWDNGAHGKLNVPKGGGEYVPLPYPLYVEVRESGFAQSVPPSRNLQLAQFAWAQPIAPVAPPEGVQRIDWITTTEDAYRVDRIPGVTADPGALRAQADQLYALGKGRSYALAAVLSGRFPSPFETLGAPAPYDPLQDAAARPATGEPGLSRNAVGQVVFFGDADWIRDADNRQLYPFLTPANAVLLQNVIDWLTLDEALVALRSRVPKDRRLADFVVEEKRKLGVLGEKQPDSVEELQIMSRLEEKALAQASARQWRKMTLPILATLLLLGGFGVVWNLLQREQRSAAK